MVIATLYVGFTPLGMIIAFCINRGFYKVFLLFGLNLADYIVSINSKLERILLK